MDRSGSTTVLFAKTISTLYFLGKSITFKDGKLIAGFGIQRPGSSTMCVRNYLVLLSGKGEILNFYINGGYPCGQEASEVTTLPELFERKSMDITP